MFGHFPELIIILAIGLIVFGPEKLPEMAANTGKMIRELREMMNNAINPEDTEVPEDFSSYYYESLARSGEDVPDTEATEQDEPEYNTTIPEAEENSDELAVLEPVHGSSLEGETPAPEAVHENGAHPLEERARET